VLDERASILPQPGPPRGIPGDADWSSEGQRNPARVILRTTSPQRARRQASIARSATPPLPAATARAGWPKPITGSAWYRLSAGPDLFRAWSRCTAHRRSLLRGLGSFLFSFRAQRRRHGVGGRRSTMCSNREQSACLPDLRQFLAGSEAQPARPYLPVGDKAQQLPYVVGDLET